MEEKFLQWISWASVIIPVIIKTILIIIAGQFIIYQGSGKRINPLKIIYKGILSVILLVARV